MNHRGRGMLVGLLLSLGSSAHALGECVSRVIDGDTVVLVDGQHVRLRGIDAPELSQPHGREAKRWLELLVAGRDVQLVEPRAAAYDRVEAAITWETTQVNAVMLKLGMAWVDPRYNRHPSWVALERDARARRVGLWAVQAAMPPWEWRRGPRKTIAEFVPLSPPQPVHWIISLPPARAGSSTSSVPVPGR